MVVGYKRLVLAILIQKRYFLNTFSRAGNKKPWQQGHFMFAFQFFFSSQRALRPNKIFCLEGYIDQLALKCHFEGRHHTIAKNVKVMAFNVFQP